MARLRKADYDRALAHANAGEKEPALDILWDLRLKADLSVYRRALVNITLAALLQGSDKVQYARECIDLLALLRQQYRDNPNISEELEHITDLETTARSMITSATPTSPRPESMAGGTSESNEPFEVTSLTKHSSDDLRDIAIRPGEDIFEQADSSLDAGPPTEAGERIQTEDVRGKESTDGDDYGVVVWQSEYRPSPPIPTDMRSVEGFLRDAYHLKPRGGETINR
ncbi:hypothetical protein OHC33_003509 [Knufia fluminis]|uniref:Uncharacterized protein n=1 Tax=Knufia fluminis TaxID=191047 RepID=A0AAN8EPB7_9EURO|nr:hypothetical protein OHC33_003509 [Knufia fluminis]